MLGNLILGFSVVFEPVKFIGLIFGFILGLVFGIIPGLSSITAVLLVLPFTFGMNPELVFIILVAAYCAALYGGSVPAILFRTPGTSSAMMTALDGYPLALQGRAGEALSISAISSSIGSFCGAMFLFLLAPWLADIALTFSATEYFALAIFGMSAITSMGRENQIKSIIALLFGILTATVGIESSRGMDRFTFGISYLLSGFDLVPVLVGIFAISEVFRQSGKRGVPGGEIKIKSILIGLPSLLKILRLWSTYLRAILIGLVVGILPGEGATVACAIAYNEEKRWSKHPEKFGFGAIEGVAVAEAANNTVAGTAMIPTLALGIPGSPTAAALIGAFLILGLEPGPQVLVQRPTLVYAIFATLIMCSILIFIFGLGVIRFLAKLLEIPYTIVGPGIILFAMWGTFSIRNNLWDVFVAIVFGVVGYLMSRYGYSLVAFTLGFILGPLAESSLLHALVLHNGKLIGFFSRPVSAVLLILSIITVIYPLIHGLFIKKKGAI